jgi:hypothetical protein
MGFGPSFNVATLTHYMMLACFPGFDDDHVVIVGDDIAINDNKMASFYERIMGKLGVQINQSKSIISPLIAEFCGKVIFADGIIQSKKIKKFEIKSISSQLEYYGDHIYFNMKGKMKKAALAYFLPPSLGGSGQPSWMSYRDWLNHLDVDYIQRYTIKQLLDDILRLRCVHSPGEAEAILREAVLWYEENIPWHHLSTPPTAGSHVINEITGLITPDHQLLSRSNAYPMLPLDQALTEDLILLRNSIQSHETSEVIKYLHSKGLVTEQGYEMEQPTEEVVQNIHFNRGNLNESRKLNIIKRFFRKHIGNPTRTSGKGEASTETS